MKRIITVVITVIILLIIQTSTAYDLIRITLGAKPDLLLIFLSFIAFRYGSFEGLIYGFAMGLIQDIISSGIFGTNALIFLNIGFFIGFFNNKTFSKQVAIGIFIAIVASTMKIILLFLINAIYSDLTSVAIFMRAELLVGMPLTMIVSSTMFIILFKISPIVYDKMGAKIDDKTMKYTDEN